MSMKTRDLLYGMKSILAILVIAFIRLRTYSYVPVERFPRDYEGFRKKHDDDAGALRPVARKVTTRVIRRGIPAWVVGRQHAPGCCAQGLRGAWFARRRHAGLRPVSAGQRARPRSLSGSIRQSPRRCAHSPHTPRRPPGWSLSTPARPAAPLAAHTARPHPRWLPGCLSVPCAGRGYRLQRAVPACRAIAVKCDALRCEDRPGLRSQLWQLARIAL